MRKIWLKGFSLLMRDCFVILYLSWNLEEGGILVRLFLMDCMKLYIRFIGDLIGRLSIYFICWMPLPMEEIIMMGWMTSMRMDALVGYEYRNLLLVLKTRKFIIGVFVLEVMSWLRWGKCLGIILKVIERVISKNLLILILVIWLKIF